MVLSPYAKQRVVALRSEGLKAPTITKRLRDEGIFVTRVGVHKFLCVYKATHTIKRRSGSGRPSKITAEIRKLVDQQMIKDDETTAYQLHQLLLRNRYSISLSTILRCRTELGWTFRGSAYCQLIRAVNKEKRLEWARTYLPEADGGFDNVVWTDESSIQLETHRRHCYRKRGDAPKCKPRYVCSKGIVINHKKDLRLSKVVSHAYLLSVTTIKEQAKAVDLCLVNGQSHYISGNQAIYARTQHYT